MKLTLNQKIERYAALGEDMSSCMSKVYMSMNDLRKADAKVILQSSCKRVGIEFPADEDKIRLCGYLTDADGVERRFWLYRAAVPLGRDVPMSLSFTVKDVMIKVGGETRKNHWS